MRLWMLVVIAGAGTLLAQAPVAGPGGALQSMPSLQLSWLERNGRMEIVGAPGPYLGVAVSGDGKRIAVHRHEETGGDIWVLEPNRRQTRITFDPGRDNTSPVWSPDDRRIAYAARKNEQWGLYHSASNGSGSEELLYESKEVKSPVSWTPDGKGLIFYVLNAETAGDLWLLPVKRGAKPAPLMASSANEWNAQVSPDGKWIAFTSDISARRDEVYVQAFPNGKEQFRISHDGGAWPRWRQDGQEIYYRADPHSWDGMSLTVESTVMAVPVSVKKQTFATATPIALQPVLALGLHHVGGGSYHSFDMTPDGQRILTFLALPQKPLERIARLLSK